MSDKPLQLVFDLPLDPRYGQEDFLVSPSNEKAYALIESWPDWPDTTLLLEGPRGSGKSHLAAIWGARTQALRISGVNIAAQDVHALLRYDALVLEDLDQLARDEATLFHLLNLAREHKTSLLMTCSEAPDRWNLRTADLLSRLRLAPKALLSAPDDALLKAVLVKLFVDRQLVVDTTVVDYVALRIERSLGRAAEIVALLDKEALARGRRVSRVMAAKILGSQDEEEDFA